MQGSVVPYEQKIWEIVDPIKVDAQIYSYEFKC
jgi:hypothetical protein